MFKVNNKDNFVNFEHISHPVLVFLLLTSSREMPTRESIRAIVIIVYIAFFNT